MLLHGFHKRRPRFSIAEGLTCNAVLQGLDDGGWRGEIHVRHPQWQDIAVGIAIPLDRVTVAKINRPIKVEFHLNPNSNFKMLKQHGR